MRLFVYFTLSLLFFGCESQQKSTELDASAFKQDLSIKRDVILLDVRTPAEVSRGALEGAINMDVSNPGFADRVASLDPSKTYYVYCLSGSRSAQAARYMNSQGITNTVNLKGGILAWQKEGFPVVAGNETADKISTKDYEQMVNGERAVLVDFYAPWCAPCMRMEPMLKELQQENQENLKIIRVNIDENKKLAKAFGVTEIPIFKYYQEGEEQWEHRGELKKNELVKKLKI